MNPEGNILFQHSNPGRVVLSSNNSACRGYFSQHLQALNSRCRRQDMALDELLADSNAVQEKLQACLAACGEGDDITEQQSKEMLQLVRPLLLMRLNQ